MPAPYRKYFLNRLTNSVLIRFLLLFASSWATLQVFAYFQSILLIFIFAAILAFLLNYPTQWLKRFLPHGVAATVVFMVGLLLLFGLLITVLFAVLSQGQELVNSVTEFLNAMEQLSRQVEQMLAARDVQIDFGAIEAKFRDQVIESIGSSVGVIQGIVNNLIDLILVAVVSFFMLLDGGRIWKWLLRGLPKASRTRFTLAMKRNFLGFFWGRFLLALFFAVSSFFVFLSLSVPVPLILAVVAGIFDMIPGIGATIGIGLISLILLPQGLWRAMQVLIACIVLQQIEENILMPRVMQNSLQMNPVVLFFALLIGSRLSGLVGLFLSIPIAGVLLSLMDNDTEDDDNDFSKVS
ncbi:AI-2E family transporter [Acaryochloris sp. CCMEE 5410]|uniref:AI-2E family transporter n=1 Tax=Acaryochloris sp. CCMEE 5410 TaxID=310037 RepID=UPI00024843FD|nr:AI-2E family transporter [Acaryochloris sp. CCMEE 5410]KAI9135259.1 AI-2E family transporter [Acaryochloris sp. CCMEE 5410]